MPVLRYPGKSLPDIAQKTARYMNDNGLDATSTFVQVDAKPNVQKLATKTSDAL
jgi:hypothetical protein